MTSEEFLDAAILGLAARGPVEKWDSGSLGLLMREDRDTWAARVVEDAMALAARRERKLAEIAAVDASTSVMKITRGTPQATPDAALDAEAQTLVRAFYGHDDVPSLFEGEWRRVALKAREMHRKTASLDECVRVYGHSIGTPRDCLRAVLYRLGVEVTP